MCIRDRSLLWCAGSRVHPRLISLLLVVQSCCLSICQPWQPQPHRRFRSQLGLPMERMVIPMCTNVMYQCVECYYHSSVVADGSCNGDVCSYVTLIGHSPAP